MFIILITLIYGRQPGEIKIITPTHFYMHNLDVLLNFSVYIPILGGLSENRIAVCLMPEHCPHTFVLQNTKF